MLPLSKKSQPISTVQIALFILILVFSISIRFNGLSSNGIHGTDTFIYWEIAQNWARGEFVFNTDPWGSDINFFRPIFYALNLLSVKLFGINDFSLRLLIGIFESGTIVLLFVLGTRLFGLTVGLVASILYSITPASLVWSQSELVHPYVSFFILASITSVYWSYPRFSNIGLIIGGILSALASLSHGSANFLILGIAISILFESWRISTNRRTFRVLFPVAMFSFAAATLYLFVMFLFGFIRSLAAILSEINIQHNYAGGVENSLSLIVDGGFIQNTSFIFTAFFFVSFIISIFITYRESKVYPAFVLILPTIYLIFYSAIFGGEANGRFFLSLVPFSALLIAFVLSTIIPSKIFFRQLLLILLILIIVIPTLIWRWGTTSALYEGREKGEARAVYEALKDVVSENNRLLVAPFQARNWPKRIDAWPYLSSNYVRYLFDCRENSLQDFFAAENVRYVYIASENLRIGSMSSIPAEVRERIGLCFAIDSNIIDYHRTSKKFNKFLKSLKPRRIYNPLLPGLLFEIRIERSS